MQTIFFEQKPSRLKTLHQILISASYFGDARFSEGHFIIYIYDFDDIYFLVIYIFSNIYFFFLFRTR